MSKVFVVQVPARRDGPRGGWVEKYDISAAEAFGTVVRILGPGNVPVDPGPTVARLRDALSGFDPSADFVLLLGDPVAMAHTVHALAVQLGGGPFRVLKWDRRADCYVPYAVGAPPQ